ncbi:MAG: dTMP kinase [Gammaproteobacteria bacterium]|nr:dTMP kinase [Gammaproteobacteria bacterium]MDE2346699.1 dTMP kinase [Gammaproteobacteria bacterium]
MNQRKSRARGKFITLEGVEGMGKSTHLNFISAYLKARGLRVQVTREPGGTPAADEIRALLLNNRREPIPPMAELLLMFAARTLHVENVIRPALASGTWIVCDRFTDATYAYQGGGRKLAARHITDLERMVLKGQQPDLTILLDADVELGLERAKQRGSLDRFEREQTAFFRRVRRVYLARARSNPRRIKLVRAAGGIAEIQTRIAQVLEQRLAAWL